MTRRRRVTIVILTPPTLLVLFLLVLYAYSWYYRLRAEQLLAAIKQLNVGVTTRQEYDIIMAPALRHTNAAFTWSDTSGKDVPIDGAGGVENLPDWFGPLLRFSDDHLPESTQNLTLRNPISFAVTPEFTDDKLSRLIVNESWGNGHPGGGLVMIYPDAFRPGWQKGIEALQGYTVQQMHNRDSGVYNSIVNMDNRATQGQRRRTLDFHFECFTSLKVCEDGTRILNPAPEPPRQRE